MKKVIVTGATGFIGMHICKELLRHGVEVYGFARSKTKAKELIDDTKFHFVEMDFEKYKDIQRHLDERNFDCFIHTAMLGVNGPDKKNYEIQLKNAVAACDAVKGAKEIGCKRFVMVGSVDEFESCFLPDEEFKQPNHARIYGLAKFAAENIGKAMAVELNIEYVSALLSLTYGEGNRNNILPNVIIRNSMTHTAMNLIEGNDYFDMIYIQDAVNGILAVAQSGRNMESYYIGHSKLRTFKEYVEEICQILKADIELKFGAYEDSTSGVDFGRIDREKITRDTGVYCKISLEEGILKTKEWLQNIDER